MATTRKKRKPAKPRKARPAIERSDVFRCYSTRGTPWGGAPKGKGRTHYIVQRRAKIYAGQDVLACIGGRMEIGSWWPPDQFAHCIPGRQWCYGKRAALPPGTEVYVIHSVHVDET
jgi:hypothetical protein